MLTAGELFEKLKSVDPDTPIRFQWIEDVYILGRHSKSEFEGEVYVEHIDGWKTLDLPCDDSCKYQSMPVKDVPKFPLCSSCEARNRYIDASRCFIYNGEVFIDGHS